MKKLLIAAAAAAMLLASCASNGEAKKDAEVPAPEHPMTDVLDLADTGDSVTFVDNTEYGESGKSTRQAKPSWTKLVKQNKVKASRTSVFGSRIDVLAYAHNRRRKLVDCCGLALCALSKSLCAACHLFCAE